MSDAHLRLIENNINVHTARSEANRKTAEFFLSLAEEDAAQVEYWLEQKREHLGVFAVSNVVPFPGVEL